ncbi:MAG: aminomethyl-transferring glycine dehydrogenase subunit GcvPB [Candidatus Methylacidiphilales bacterium]
MKTASIFDKSQPGTSGTSVQDREFPAPNPAHHLDPADLRTDPPPLPELAEVDVVRHFTNLSRFVHGVDNGPYPLGSCTMKYNPKRHDEVARLDGFRHAHPLQPADTLPGLWQAFGQLQEWLAELTGMDHFSLQPAAGAHGEFAGLLMIRKHFASLRQPRSVILIPDSAHGTNPASASMAGFTCKIIPTTENGLMDLGALETHLKPDVAALMLTNPSTLGLFEENIETIAARLHGNGSLLYYDGANLNALMGIVRPGDMGFDVIHLNTHKTLSTPHGGGGPGAGPVGVKAFLEPYLPRPVIRKMNGQYAPDFDRPHSIGKVKACYGHTEVLLRAAAYLLSCGGIGLRTATENAVLNANYLQHKLRDLLPPVFSARCMHECLLSGGDLKVNAFDFVKRLIDFGIHPPTLVGAGCVHFAKQYDAAMLIEPTETETRASLDLLVEGFRKVASEAAVAPYMIETAPHTTAVAKIIKDQAAYISMLEATAPDPSS